jgi:hypothetical protein
LALIDVAAELPLCTCENPAKSKKKSATPCHSYAKYQKEGKYYCKKHAASSPFRIPIPEESIKVLKKKKKTELMELVQQNHLGENKNWSKEECVKRLGVFFRNRSLEPVVEQQVRSADEVNLVDIGKSLKRQLDAQESVRMGDITDVVIENQISPIATRMKTIQGMLAQYFIMRFENSHIEFVSSSNKLKLFRKESKEPISNTPLPNQVENVLEPTTQPTQSSTYRENKKDGVFYCSGILQQNPLLEKWRTCMEAKKKDDFADCFLQGLWYMHSKKTILVAEDLKINVL